MGITYCRTCDAYSATEHTHEASDRGRVNATAVVIALMALLAIVAAVGALIVGYVMLVSDALDDGHGLPACVTEDSRNCVWDAADHGNGEGQSFVDIDGVAYYLGSDR